jgi:diguanylate cyclase (GGDEF)-like protein
MHDVEAALRNRDTLTGAYGRADLLPELREWLELGRRGVEPCSIAFMDLDDLKGVNDAWGHAVGDRFLVGAVQYLLDHLRPYDKVFRYGGDEFLMSMPGLEVATAWSVIERIRAGLERTPLLADPEGRRIRVTASFGVAPLEPDVPVEESIDRADKALLVAKAAGRNRAIAWDPSVTTGTITSKVLEDDPAS